jgi:hypothetical protein
MLCRVSPLRVVVNGGSKHDSLNEYTKYGNLVYGMRLTKKCDYVRLRKKFIGELKFSMRCETE